MVLEQVINKSLMIHLFRRKRVQKTVGSWRSGKFNPLVSRSYSLNSYCLSKLWFRTSSLDLRVSDVTFLHTKCKSYVYQDLLQKPSELVLFRPREQGGLGLHNIDCKARAHLIATFLQTAANPRFISSQFHSALYKYHVLGEQEGVPSPGLPPYYNKVFFNTIRKVHEKSPLNPVQMSVGQWYQYLLEETMTMVEDEEGRRTAKLCRVEELQPSVDWGRSFSLARLKGLSPNNKSVMFKLLHQLLPTGERVHRLQPNKNPGCSLCRTAPLDNLMHSIFECEANQSAAMVMLRCGQCYAPSLSAAGLLRLEVDAQDPFALPTVVIIATGIELIWTNRMKSAVTSQAAMRAELEARAGLFRQARGRRLREAGAIMANILAITM